MAEEGDGIFEGLAIASWAPKGVTLPMYFAVEQISASGGNRHVERERPYRDGAKIDDTGSKARKWRLECLFHNSQDEPGLERNDRPMYPDMLDEMIGSCDSHETGDLMLPTGGPYRVKFESYERVEKSEERDSGRVTFCFTADNEDVVGADSFMPPTVDASAKQLAADTVFSAQADSIWNGDMGGDGVPTQSFDALLGQLEDLASTPETAASELADSGEDVRLKVQRVRRLAFRVSDPLGIVDSPTSSRTERKFVNAEDMAGRARAARSASRPSIVSITIDRRRTLASVAAEKRQPYEELLAINLGRIDDPNALEDGDVIRVFG